MGKKGFVVAVLHAVEGTTDKAFVVSMLENINVKLKEESMVSAVRERGVLFS